MEYNQHIFLQAAKRLNQQTNRIVFIEGVWGSGKTTTIQKVQKAVAASGKSCSYISDENESYTTLFTQTADTELFINRYQKAWSNLISGYSTESFFIFECDLFSGLGQHRLEHEMPVQSLLDFVEELLHTIETGNVYVLFLTPKDMGKSWNHIIKERGSAWEKYITTTILSDTNLNRKNKHPCITAYRKELDVLYRQIFTRLQIRKLQVETAVSSWEKSLDKIFKFLDLSVVELKCR